MLRNIDLMRGLETAMAGLAARQKVTAANIANADTPGYRARDVERPDFGDLVNAKEAAAGADGPGRPAVARTEAMRRLTQQRGGRTIADAEITETKADGNNVTIETQMLRMAEVQGQYAAAANLYRKSVSLLKVALGAGRG